MKRLAALLLSITLFIGLTAKADLNSVSALTVKVRSGKSSSARLSFAGSGVLFRDGKNAYALTSEHVLVHSNAFRHTVENSVIGTVKSEITAVDWGFGLALLKLKSLPEKILQALPSRELFSGASAEANEMARVFGFPHQSDTAIETEGEIIAPQSRRHAIPLLDTMLEVLGAHGEYGMSGGPVFSTDGQAVLGILSHQYIELAPGGRSSIRESRKAATTQNHLLVIGAAEVRAFLNRYFSNPGQFIATFVRDPEAQYAGQDVVLSGDLRFETLNPSVSAATPVGGGDVVGIGGGDVVGIGGGDAIGIGGGDVVGIGGIESRVFKTPFVEVSRARSHSPFPSGWAIRHRETWFRALSAKVANGNAVRIAYFVEMSATGMPLRTGFFNAVGFVQNLLKPDLLPFSFSGNSTASAAKLDEIQKAGEKLAALLAELTPDTLAFNSGQAKPLTDTLSLVADAARSQEWSELKDILNSEFLHSLEKDPLWDGLFYSQFDTTVELMKLVVQIRQLSESK